MANELRGVSREYHGPRSRPGQPVYRMGNAAGAEAGARVEQAVQRYRVSLQENIAEIEKLLVAVGEFSWEATLTQTADQDGDWTAPLGLPPLPTPFELTFVLDSERDPGQWQSLKAGDRVRFTGRFIRFDDDLWTGGRDPFSRRSDNQWSRPTSGGDGPSRRRRCAAARRSRPLISAGLR